MENVTKLASCLYLGLLLAQPCICQTFTLTGHENLTGPGNAHLFLITNDFNGLENETIRVEISGPMAGVLIYDEVVSVTDLGYFHLDEGNYTFDIYILDDPGATLEESGTAHAQGQVKFTIPSPPEPTEPDQPLIDPVNLGFMITALFVFGLVLAIWRTGKGEGPPATEEQ